MRVLSQYLIQCHLKFNISEDVRIHTEKHAGICMAFCGCQNLTTL